MIQVENLSKTHARGDGTAVEALRSITFDIGPGEFVVVRGSSGSGKSTLLNILGCLDRPTKVTYRLHGDDILTSSDSKLASIRNRNIGFVFQSFNLLARTTALENIELPMVYRAGRVDRKKALRALERVGLGGRAQHFSSELSGGEQQRVAIARALINDPPIIFADEPTGNLDQVSGAQVMQILRELWLEGRTVVLITHDEAIATYGERELLLRDGQLISDRQMAPLAQGEHR